jgi:hypothetical protein
MRRHRRGSPHLSEEGIIEETRCILEEERLDITGCLVDNIDILLRDVMRKYIAKIEKSISETLSQKGSSWKSREFVSMAKNSSLPLDEEP